MTCRLIHRKPRSISLGALRLHYSVVKVKKLNLKVYDANRKDKLKPKIRILAHLETFGGGESLPLYLCLLLVMHSQPLRGIASGEPAIRAPSSFG